MVIVRLVLAALLGLVLVAPAAADGNGAPKKDSKKEASSKKKHPDRKHKRKIENFPGEIVHVSAKPDGTGAIVVKHANGKGKGFGISRTTKITGATQRLASLTKGSLVVVRHAGGKAVLVAVRQLAPPSHMPNPTGAFTGKIIQLKTDQFGDKGDLTVKPAKGRAQTFQVTNGTTIDYQEGGEVILHTMQGLGKGMTVRVQTAGKLAVHIDRLTKHKVAKKK